MIAENKVVLASREALVHLKVVTDMLRSSSYEVIEQVFVTLKKSPSDKKAL